MTFPKMLTSVGYNYTADPETIPADLLAMIAGQHTMPITSALTEPEVPVEFDGYTLSISNDTELEPELTVSAMVDQMIAVKAALQAERDADELVWRASFFDAYSRSYRFVERL